MSIEIMFSSIAKRYDLCNDLMSMRLHRLWNKKLIQSTLLPLPPKTYLDLCSGTGEISFRFLQMCEGEFPSPHETYLLDFSSDMLSAARQKSKHLKIDQNNIIFLKANAEEIPLESNSIEAITLAYGIRNIFNPLKCLKEIERVLKPEGRVGILELTRPPHPWIALAHSCYLKTWVPLIGRLFSPNRRAYQYLRQSIHSFVPPEELKNWLDQVGFDEVKVTQLTGGIATLLSAQKAP